MHLLAKPMGGNPAGMNGFLNECRAWRGLLQQQTDADFQRGQKRKGLPWAQKDIPGNSGLIFTGNGSGKLQG